MFEFSVTGAVGSCPRRSHYIRNTSLLPLKNFGLELQAVQMALIWPHADEHQRAVIWTMRQASLSISFLLFPCYRRIQLFQDLFQVPFRTL